MMRPITITIFFAILSLFLRERGIRFGQLFKTPHDRLMFLYLIWIWVSSDDFEYTLGHSYPLLIFYILVVQVAYDPDRLKSFVKWWAIMMYAIAFLAWASEIGFDPMGSYIRTHGSRLQGRLILNTSLFNNPNALGHSVVPLLGVVYLYYGWRQSIFRKLAGGLLAVIPAYTIYLTQSKGTFLSGYVMLMSMLCIRRKLVTKIILITTMLTVGSAAIMYLPRMEDLRRTDGQREEGIEGRIAAWDFGLECLQHRRLLGYAGFPEAFFQSHGFQKPSHSSYVQIGAELSYPGLFFFVGLMYISIRTLIEIRTKDPEMERIRRILFVMLIAYAASGWTVDFAYRATFFMLIGTIAALHRLHLPAENNTYQINLELPTEPAPPQKALFTRLRIIDIPIMICLTWLTVRVWIYLRNWV